MAYDNAWSIIITAGSDNLNPADDQIRQLRKDIGQRMDDVVDDFTTDPVVPQKLDVSRIDGTPDLARVYTDADVNIPDNVFTVVTFNQETFDTGGFHDNSSNNSRLTITTAAYYRIRAVLKAQGSGGSNAAIGFIAIRENGVTIASRSEYHNGTTSVQSFFIETIVLAAAADYYEVWLNQASTAAWTVGQDSDKSYFEIERLVGTV